MKKFVTFTLLLSFVLSFACFARFENKAVVDNAEYLSADEYRAVSEKLDEIREKYNFDVAVYTEYEMSGIDAESTADDIYDYGGYGYGGDFDGIMLYISDEERQYHITTCGYGIYAFTDNGLEYLEKNIKPHLKNGDYYSAMTCYAQVCDELLGMAKEGTPYNQTHRGILHYIIIIGLALLIPFLVAKSKTKKKLSQMKTAVKQKYADNCLKAGSLRMAVSKDLFLYSTVSKTPRAKSNTDSSTHRSSSGRTHGGRGGSF